jgi:quercetin dioxygenase-like cupin family protein
MDPLGDPGAMTTQTTTSADLDFLGARVRLLGGDEQTGGRVGTVDMVEVPAGDMPPLHVHHDEDEAFCVLDGEVTLFLPGRQIHCGPGDVALAPRGVPHTYRVGERPARWIVLSAPAGFERFVAAVAGAGPVDPPALAAIAAEHRIEILGPPGTLP